MKQYRVSRYTININKPINKKGTIRVAFLSDLHNADWGKNNRLLLSMIDEENPDIVLCGGDMLVAYPGEDVVKAAMFMNELADRYPTYYGYGNHEYRLKIYPETYGDMYRHYKKLLNEDKVHILDNDKIEIFVNGIELCIYGLTIKRKYYQRFKRIPMTVSEIREALGSPNKNMITILLAHTPK